MKPEDIVVSLEWAKHLEEAGWPQEECLWWWTVYRTGRVGLRSREKFGDLSGESDAYLASPTAEEILRRLKTVHGSSCYVCGFNGRGMAFCADTWEPHEVPTQFASTLADAAAALYCHLAEQELLPKAA